MMRLFTAVLAGLLAWSASAFAPSLSNPSTTKTSLAMAATNRRDFLGASGASIGSIFFLSTSPAQAFSQQLDDYAREPQQQYTDGRLDLNAAFVGDYKALRGMFPTAAGKIASHGPYKTVKDIYKIPDLTAHDKELFQKYEASFTVNPPGRVFDERINARVST